MSSIKETGMKEAIQGIENIEKYMPKIVQKVYSELNDSRNNVLISMKRTPRQAKTIRVPKRKNVLHHPSKKDNPPAIMKGLLSGGLDITKKRNQIEMGTTAPYGPALETGHHPYMKPEFENLKKRMPQSLQEVFK